jgi:predicted RND superfamily exporter protein
LGFAIVFIYVVLMLGRIDLVHNRIFLSLSGLFSVLMAIVISYGTCCSLGFAFTPLHNFIPFLLMGLGIRT